jgi:putative flippase GtrA
VTILQKLQSITLKEPVRYLIAGGSAFVVDYGVLVLSYYVIGVSLGLSTTLGYFFGFFISFFANRYWVFGKSGTTRKPLKQIIEYTALVIFNYFFTLIAIQQLDKLGIKPSIGKIIIMAVIVVWNYLIFQKFIFSDKKAAR